MTTLAETRAEPKIFPSLAGITLVVCVALVPFMTGNIFHFHIAIMICLAVMATSGLAVIAWVGQLSMAHGAFVGLGAYVSALMVMRFGAPVIVGSVIAAIVSGGVAFVIGMPLLRLRGVYFVLITFALNELYRLLMLEFPGISGGSNGLTGIPPLSIAGFPLATKNEAYPFVLACAVLVLAFLWLMHRGVIGRTFAAVEQNLPLAESSGFPTARIQSLAFTIGSGIAGFTGAIMAHYIGFISPETFGFQLSVSYVVMLVVGGRLALWGPLVGAIFMTALPEFLRGAVQYQHIIFGIILIGVLQFLPQGLISLPGRLLGKKARSS